VVYTAITGRYCPSPARYSRWSNLMLGARPMYLQDNNQQRGVQWRRLHNITQHSHSPRASPCCDLLSASQAFSVKGADHNSSHVCVLIVLCNWPTQRCCAERPASAPAPVLQVCAHKPAAGAVACCSLWAGAHLSCPVLGVIQQCHAAAAAVANHHQVLACTLRATLQGSQAVQKASKA
jgi:hypothetical protein